MFTDLLKNLEAPDPIQEVFQGDSLELLKHIPDNFFDGSVLDPPSAIRFMGKSWDNDKGGRDNWIRWLAGILAELLRTLKPGAYICCWALPKTSYMTGMAIDLAGFEIVDEIPHLFGSGFPKNYNVAKGIESYLTQGSAGNLAWRELKGERTAGQIGFVKRNADAGYRPADYELTGSLKLEATTLEAQNYNGFGTALKPGHEKWILARKPLIGNYVKNILEYGTGALNIDACRVTTADKLVRPPVQRDDNQVYGQGLGAGVQDEPGGRWPANVLFSHSPNCNGTCAPGCPVAELDRQSGYSISKPGPRNNNYGLKFGEESRSGSFGKGIVEAPYADEGGASRFYNVFSHDDADRDLFLYIAKPPKTEKNAGLDKLPKKQKVFNGKSATASSDPKPVEQRFTTDPAANIHPTVKPLALIKHLTTLIAPPGRKQVDGSYTPPIIVDPFAGSGTGGAACAELGLHWVGFELDGDGDGYIDIARGRIAFARAKRAADLAAPKQLSLFDFLP